MNAPFVLAAGGTGGHLFPAQALAGELMRRGRRVIVMTDGRGHNYGSAFPGAEIATVPAATFAGRSALGRVAAFGVIALGVLTALLKLLNLRPRAVVGFGGYPSLPVMLAASFAHVPTALHEQNAVLGRVNRLLAPRVGKIAANFPFVRFAPAHPERVVFTGNPVRAEAAALRATPYTPPAAGAPIRLLIFGGSQGARALSEIVPAALAHLPEELRARLEITQQARAEDLALVQDAYRAAGLNADIAKFFTDLPRRMASSHLVIARSGASTLSELTVIGRPSILVPYPHAMDDHQAANAAVLDRAGAAWVVAQSALTPEGLAQLLTEILNHPQMLADRAEAAKALGHQDAAARLADLAESLGQRGGA
ncbi:MAG TPA: undecaprenyldiphospho-muramoylpentapeptide beta-N-acetylglucosaminyltransferase [Micropepsaceae bacterium]|jgi:UDP-N-acetylglucosamine--N-acetylmuramyl-(pentapeptide) pyrophosphoryl-undecaprenol N-acetylglucosamine transferase|nr:undecaprenyldiphospho-muramoylpentapeptide beta-N-acetylglucosaminyltransferase [Micropepsaceae bacterium]